MQKMSASRHEQSIELELADDDDKLVQVLARAHRDTSDYRAAFVVGCAAANQHSFVGRASAQSISSTTGVSSGRFSSASSSSSSSLSWPHCRLSHTMSPYSTSCTNDGIMSSSSSLSSSSTSSTPFESMMHDDNTTHSTISMSLTQQQQQHKQQYTCQRTTTATLDGATCPGQHSASHADVDHHDHSSNSSNASSTHSNSSFNVSTSSSASMSAPLASTTTSAVSSAVPTATQTPPATVIATADAAPAVPPAQTVRVDRPADHADTSSSNNNNDNEFANRFSSAITNVVEFAKRIPGFALLPQDDQVTLLKASVFEVLLVRVANTYDPHTETLVCTNGVVVNRHTVATGTSERAGCGLTPKVSVLQRAANARQVQQQQKQQYRWTGHATTPCRAAATGDSSSCTATNDVTLSSSSSSSSHLDHHHNQSTLQPTSTTTATCLTTTAPVNSNNTCQRTHPTQCTGVQSSATSNARFLMDSLFQFGERMAHANLSDTELALYCACVVMATDRPGVRNVQLVQRISTRLNALFKRIIADNHADNPRLFDELQSKIPDLRTLNTLHSEKLLASSTTSTSKSTISTNTSTSTTSATTTTAVTSQQFVVEQASSVAHVTDINTATTNRKQHVIETTTAIAPSQLDKQSEFIATETMDATNTDIMSAAAADIATSNNINTNDDNVLDETNMDIDVDDVDDRTTNEVDKTTTTNITRNNDMIDNSDTDAQEENTNNTDIAAIQDQDRFAVTTAAGCTRISSDNNIISIAPVSSAATTLSSGSDIANDGIEKSGTKQDKYCCNKPNDYDCNHELNKCSSDEKNEEPMVKQQQQQQLSDDDEDRKLIIDGQQHNVNNVECNADESVNDATMDCVQEIQPNNDDDQVYHSDHHIKATVVIQDQVIVAADDDSDDDGDGHDEGKRHNSCNNAATIRPVSERDLEHEHDADDDDDDDEERNQREQQQERQRQARSNKSERRRSCVKLQVSAATEPCAGATNVADSLTHQQSNISRTNQQQQQQTTSASNQVHQARANRLTVKKPRSTSSTVGTLASTSSGAGKGTSATAASSASSDKHNNLVCPRTQSSKSSEDKGTSISTAQHRLGQLKARIDSPTDSGIESGKECSSNGMRSITPNGVGSSSVCTSPMLNSDSMHAQIDTQHTQLTSQSSLHHFGNTLNQLSVGLNGVTPAPTPPCNAGSMIDNQILASIKAELMSGSSSSTVATTASSAASATKSSPKARHNAHHRHTETAASQPVASSRSSSVVEPPPASGQQTPTIDDMPMLKRALQAPPLINTNMLMDEAYRHHKKFRAAQRKEYADHQAVGSTTTATTAISSLNGTADPAIVRNNMSTPVLPKSQILHQHLMSPLSSNNSSNGNIKTTSESNKFTNSALLKTLGQPSRYMNDQQLKRTDLIHNLIIKSDQQQNQSIANEQHKRSEPMGSECGLLDCSRDHHLQHHYNSQYHQHANKRQHTLSNHHGHHHHRPGSSCTSSSPSTMSPSPTSSLSPDCGLPRSHINTSTAAASLATTTPTTTTQASTHSTILEQNRLIAGHYIHSGHHNFHHNGSSIIAGHPYRSSHQQAQYNLLHSHLSSANSSASTSPISPCLTTTSSSQQHLSLVSGLKSLVVAEPHQSALIYGSTMMMHSPNVAHLSPHSDNAHRIAPPPTTNAAAYNLSTEPNQVGSALRAALYGQLTMPGMTITNGANTTDNMALISSNHHHRVPTTAAFMPPSCGINMQHAASLKAGSPMLMVSPSETVTSKCSPLLSAASGHSPMVIVDATQPLNLSKK